jgi:hypothetical protein
MSSKNYEQVRNLTSHIINARFGEMVDYSEQLIATDVWRDFTTPRGTHFEFRACEYDYFLAAQGIDALTLRYAYIHRGSVAQQHRLADITGKGKPPKEVDRRERDEVAQLYADAPGGAGQRIQAWAKEALVSEKVAAVARNPEHRRQREKGEAAITSPEQRRWDVRWSDGRSRAEAIVAKLAQTPALEEAVYKLLHARNSVRKYELKARNSKKNGTSGARHLARP